MFTFFHHTKRKPLMGVYDLYVDSGQGMGHSAGARCGWLTVGKADRMIIKPESLQDTDGLFMAFLFFSTGTYWHYLTIICSTHELKQACTHKLVLLPWFFF